MLKVGDTAPINTNLISASGEEVTLKSFLNDKYLLVYFYPKDDTPACTTEACELRDFNNDIKALGTVIVGISKDNTKSHNKFKKKFNLNFELLSDEDHKLQEEFGVWQLKKFMRKEFMGTLRTTFLLNNKGKILKVWENVKAEGHAKEVYEYIKELK